MTLYNNVIELESVDSTNSYLKRELNILPEGTVVFARMQTAGRGKGERKWFGEPDCSLFCSFLSKNFSSPVEAIRANFKFSLIVRDALLHYLQPSQLRLKWPNDLLAGSNRKICGILSEYSAGSVITGIGINLKPFALPPELEAISANLEELCGKAVELDRFKTELLAEANRYNLIFAGLPTARYPDLWYREAAIDSRRIRVETGRETIEGAISGITDYGALLLTDKNQNIQTITTGDITYYD